MARNLKEIGSEQEQSFNHNQDFEFDHMLASVSESVLDSRRYCWPNLNKELLVHHHRHKFVYSFQLPAVSQYPHDIDHTFLSLLQCTVHGNECSSPTHSSTIV